MKAPSVDILYPEFNFSASRSSGPGGQNVNKVNSKVTLEWNVSQSALLSEDEKTVILRVLESYINKDGFLQLTSQEARSQLQNKEATVKKLQGLLTRAFIKKKTRKQTKTRPSEKAAWRKKEVATKGY